MLDAVGLHAAVGMAIAAGGLAGAARLGRRLRLLNPLRLRSNELSRIQLDILLRREGSIMLPSLHGTARKTFG